MGKQTPKKDEQIDALKSKLNAILAVLLRQINDEGLTKWNKQDKQNMVKMLIDFDFSNDEIERILDVAYGTVANIRSKLKKEGKKK